jgi:NADH-quinone oxidoreductase subunit L
MSSFMLWLIPVLPLAGFLVNGILRPPKMVAALVGCAGPIVSFVLSLIAFQAAPVEQNVFGWITVVGEKLHIPFGLRVDQLAAVMLLVVTGVGSLIHIYSVSYMNDDEGFARFFAYLNLFMFSMLVLVMGDSVALMFLGWEGVGLCSYLLIGFWYKDLKNADAGKKAFITNRIGDFGFILGIFCLWQMFHTLDFKEMSGHHAIDEKWATAAAFLLFVGACGKSAQIPLYVWLPDAMAGPTPVSALIHAATMVTAGVYMMARMNFLYVAAPGVLELVVLIAALTAFMAGVIAVAQNDIKKVLAYSTVSQLGFMFAGIAAADFTAGIFHVVTHAFFKALLFLGAGAVIHTLHGEQDIRKMGGLGRKLPALTAVFVIGGLALAGMPGTSGFFSKDAILAAVYLKSGIYMSFAAAWTLLVVTASLTAFYTTRLVLLVFLDREGHDAGHEEAPHELHKPGLLMMGPLAVLAVLSLAAGVWLNADHRFEKFLGPVWGHEEVHPAHGGHGLDAHTVNVYVSIGAFVLGAGLSAVLYARSHGREAVQRWVEGPMKGLHRLVSNKFYVDEIYEVLVIAPVRMGATVAWFLIDRILIDAILVNGTGRLVYALGGIVRRPHTGSINVGAVSFVLGVLAVLSYLAIHFEAWKIAFPF